MTKKGRNHEYFCTPGAAPEMQILSSEEKYSYLVSYQE